VNLSPKPLFFEHPAIRMIHWFGGRILDTTGFRFRNRQSGMTNMGKEIICQDNRKENPLPDFRQSLQKGVDYPPSIY
ncbi:MAG: hypothetical protein AABZ40_05800, partial [Thermodesulfobacteriota bacterium]